MDCTGRCLCGAVAYRARGAPLDVATCHCINCRRMSGAAFATVVVFPPDRFELRRGELGTHAATSDLIRGFRRDCGSPVASWRESERETWIVVWAGTLGRDGHRAGHRAGRLAPRHHIFARHELPWLRLGDGLPRHARFPEAVLTELGLDSGLRNRLAN